MKKKNLTLSQSQHDKLISDSLNAAGATVTGASFKDGKIEPYVQVGGEVYKLTRRGSLIRCPL